MGPDADRGTHAERRPVGSTITNRPLNRRLVVDASLVVQACLEAEGFEPLAGYDLAAPSLLWSEVLSALHEGRFRGEMSRALVDAARERLEQAAVRAHASPALRARAWEIAEDLGWAKTYDAEYLALAESLGCPLATLDARLVRGARGRVRMVGPNEL